MTDSLVLVDRPSEGVALLTLNRPDKKNALSIEARDAAVAALAALADDHATKCVVVTGAGDVFCSGFDLKEFETAFSDEAFAARLWESSDAWHRAWLEFPVATVAAVNGTALAGGLDLAIMCDLRVVAETAYFAHPEIAFGDVVYGPLHDLVGGSAARDLVLTGREFGAQEALSLGLANRVVATDQVVKTALELAEQICVAPADVLRRTKAKISRRAGVEPGKTLDL
ncbi:MAG: enoyl-CoA hydratase/isomerase family protein [Actinobacteria bacterium]|nr:enoyl-CoA hydratase/isomerase family protein [Actinomycetota bacterium]